MRLRSLAFAAVMAATAVSFANSYTYSLNGGATINLGTSYGVGYNVDTTGATGAMRGFVIGGNWSAGGGDPWSSEFRARLTGISDVGTGTVLDRFMGGANSGAAFTFGGQYSNFYNSAAAPRNTTGEILTGTAIGAVFNVDMRQTFAGSNAFLDNGTVTFLTDIVDPVQVTIDANSPTYQRATSVTAPGTGTVHGSGAVFRYGTTTFTAQASGLHMVAGDYRTAFDGWISLYEGSFNPASPLTNIIGVDDDGAYALGASNNFGSNSMWINLTAGTSYTVVWSHFSATPPSGTMTGYIAGPVPEPASMAVLGLGVAALVARRRKKSK